MMMNIRPTSYIFVPHIYDSYDVFFFFFFFSPCPWGIQTRIFFQVAMTLLKFFVFVFELYFQSLKFVNLITDLRGTAYSRDFTSKWFHNNTQNKILMCWLFTLSCIHSDGLPVLIFESWDRYHVFLTMFICYMYNFPFFALTVYIGYVSTANAWVSCTWLYFSFIFSISVQMISDDFIIIMWLHHGIII